jgi:hypothetical protein
MRRMAVAWQESQHHESVEAAWHKLYPDQAFPGFDHEDGETGEVVLREHAETRREWRNRRFGQRVVRAPRLLRQRRRSSRRTSSRRVRGSRGAPRNTDDPPPEPPLARAGAGPRLGLLGRVRGSRRRPRGVS